MKHKTSTRAEKPRQETDTDIRPGRTGPSYCGNNEELVCLDGKTGEKRRTEKQIAS